MLSSILNEPVPRLGDQCCQTEEELTDGESNSARKDQNSELGWATWVSQARV